MIAATRGNAARAGLNCTVHKEHIEGMSYRDRAFDTIVAFACFITFQTSKCYVEW